MAENLGKWPSKRGPISKIRPSDGCGRDAGPSAVERRYDFPEFGGHLGNVGLLFLAEKLSSNPMVPSRRGLWQPCHRIAILKLK